MEQQWNIKCNRGNSVIPMADRCLRLILCFHFGTLVFCLQCKSVSLSLLLLSCFPHVTN